MGEEYVGELAILKVAVGAALSTLTVRVVAALAFPRLSICVTDKTCDPEVAARNVIGIE
jgi:hypothetical protein